MQRRDFITRTLAGSAAAALGIENAFAQATKDQPAAGKKPPTVADGIQRHRVLGRTGLWVSDIGMGTGALGHPATAMRAIELGVNYFDTAPDYGEAETVLGKALKATKVDRQSVVITSKMCEPVSYPGHLGQKPGKPATLDDIVRCCEGSLKRLQTDYLDVLMVHAVGEPENDRRFDREDLPEAIDKLKKDGKIRFAGASSHGSHNTTALLKQAINSGLIHVLMPGLNYLKNLKGSTPADLTGILALAKEKGVGVIAMKTVPREKDSQQLTDLKKKFDESTSYSHICFAWALAQEPVAALVRTMKTVGDVEEYVQSSGAKLTAANTQALKVYAAALGGAYCRIGCGDCHSACPAQVPIADLLRFNEYFVNYGLEKHAMRRFADLNGHRRLTACQACDAPCERACTYDLPVRSLLAGAQDNLHFDPYVTRA